MVAARIYRPHKNAMQSGYAKTDQWVLEFLPDTPLYIEPLMGWTGSYETTRQLILRFPTQEAAIAYAKKNNIPFELYEPKQRKIKPKAYADNFRFNKRDIA